MLKSAFQQSALTSGLLTREDLDEAISLIRAERRLSGPVPDERLAKKLIELGKLNRWQAEQLNRGRTKFTLGAYLLTDSIGRGGMGEVYRAEHSMMGRVVAVKILPPHKTTPESIASFLREIRTQAQLDHENLVRAYDAGHDSNVHFLVTEYVPGSNLRNLIRRGGRLSMQSAASIISQAGRGLAYAHSRGLIHRDVKPGNLLVTPDGHTKVSDLGLSGYFNDPEQTDIHGGKVVGTADYLAPEQITAPERPTPISDIYSLGCTLYYAVTGKVPFPGGTAREKALSHRNQFPLDPRRLNSELSDEFVEVIADMMAKNPEDRIPTANAVMERLAPWVEGVALSHPTAAVATPGQLTYTAPRPTVPEPGPTGLSDTTPIFVPPAVEDPSQVESPSQLSLGTQPVGLASQETLPMFTLEPWNTNLSPSVKVLITIGMITALGTILAVVIGLIFSAASGG
ncbi:MAG TPA: serine/threonine-protein kinase [Pirellulales bacterium]|nr:serine/threonine-protein kinase [Pirellulales bacterium]